MHDEELVLQKNDPAGLHGWLTALEPKRLKIVDKQSDKHRDVSGGRSFTSIVSIPWSLDDVGCEESHSSDE